MENKNLNDSAKLKNVYISKCVTKAVNEKDTLLRKQKYDLTKSEDEDGNVHYDQKIYNAKKGTFKVSNLGLKYFSYPTDA